MSMPPSPGPEGYPGANPEQPNPYASTPYDASASANNAYGANTPYDAGANSAYGANYPLMPGYYGPVEHPQATTILVLGVLGLVACQVMSPIALVMGNKARREIAAQPGRYSETGLITAGWVCGIIGTVLLVIALVIVVVVIGLGIFTAGEIFENMPESDYNT